MPDDVDVLLLGDLNVDLVLDVPALPPPGGESVATRQRVGFGGSAANTAVVLSRLGASCALVCCVGDDEWGALAAAGLAEAGVDTSLVRRTAADGTSVNIVAVTADGERTMYAYRGASALLTDAAVPRDLRGAGMLHVSGYALLAEPQRSAARVAAESARERGVRVSLDVPVDLVRSAPDQLRAFLPLVDVVAIGSDDAQLLTGTGGEDAAREIAALGPGLVAVKRGDQGVLLVAGAQRVTLPAPRVDAVDSTGAGDSFCAGLLFALHAGASLEAAGLFANACGAAAVCSPGAGASLPGRADVARVIDAYPAELRDRARELLG
ncbi:MAG: carbohydrate kinase family protein [Microbacterium sp.]|uniref:carbohydrate kinase family protein n=1 Tax=Microbacterium sp. TaxID=51671 RepID=UPI0039E3E454